MWGFGGRYYWGRRTKVDDGKGIVVVFAWMSSEDKHLKNYVDLYAGWNSLICHSQFLNLFFPDKAAALALKIAEELVKELKLRPCPVVLASFSGGPKACMYKLIQIIEGKCEEQSEQINLDDCRLIRNCIAGHILDSTPVDFVSDLGTRFVLHPSILKMARPPLLATWIANGISSSLDALFLSRFESQRADYWQTLYSTVSMRAPYLILCSEDDDLAPFHIIFNFATRLKDLGAEVKLVKWSSSSHVGHFRRYPEEYRASVTELLGKASATYSRRTAHFEGEKMVLEGPPNAITDPFRSLRKATAESSQSSVESKGHFFVPASLEYHEDRDVGSVRDEYKERYVSLSNTRPHESRVHGVLGQFVFDSSLPRDVEDWDLRSSVSLGVRAFPYFNLMKCVRRSRL